MKNDPKKKVSKCVWGYFGGVFMMFSDGFDAFLGPPDPNLGPLSPCVRPVGAYEAASRGLGDLAVLGDLG